MKLKFSLKNKEASFEADIEGLVEKKLDYNATVPIKKTKYQIKQEEKRKNEAEKHKRQMQYLYIGLGMLIFLIVVAIVSSILGI